MSLLASLFQCMANNLGFCGDIVISPVSSQPSTLKAQLRLLTMSGNTIDIYSVDFYGTGLPRYSQESDPHYVNRIQAGLFIPRLTRPAFFNMLLQYTGIAPHLIESWRPSDVGGLTKTTGIPFTSGGKQVYALPTNMPASYYGVDNAGAPFRFMNPGGRYGINPGYAYQSFIDTTWPAGFGAQGNEADGMMTVTGSNPPDQYGGTVVNGSPSVYTNLSGAGLMSCPNSSIELAGGKSVFGTITSGDPNGALFNPVGLKPNDLFNGQAQVLTAIDRLRAEGVTIWARCVPAAALYAQGWTA